MKIKKVLDWRKLRQDEENSKVSIYILAKREMRYRKSQEKDFGKNCFNCRARNIVDYKDRSCSQCAWIGIIGDRKADVDQYHVCNFHEQKVCEEIKLLGE